MALARSRALALARSRALALARSRELVRAHHMSTSEQARRRERLARDLRHHLLCTVGTVENLSAHRSWKPRSQCSTKAAIVATTSMCSIDPKAQLRPLPPFRPLASGGKTAAESARRKSAICAPGQTRCISPSRAARSANQGFLPAVIAPGCCCVRAQAG